MRSNVRTSLIVGLSALALLGAAAGCRPAARPAGDRPRLREVKGEGQKRHDERTSPVAETGLKDGAAAEAPAGAILRPTEKSWPLFRGDAFATGVAPGSLPEKPELLWTFAVEGGAFEATPVIVGGVVYIGDLDGSVYALSLKSGEKIWEHKTESGFVASPAAIDGRLYIGDYDGVFYCLEAEKGTVLWTYETGAEINSSPNFYKGNVLVGSQDATLYCFKKMPEGDGKEGELVWSHQIDDQIRCSPTVVEDRCFVAGCDGKLHILDLSSGEAVAAVEIDGPTGVTPAVKGDYVYFGTEGGTQYAVHWKEAETAWTFQDGRLGQPIRSCPAVTEKLVVFGSRGKQVYALNRDSGKEAWRFAAKGRVDSSPVVVGERAFFGSADGRVYGLSLKDGSAVWEFEAGGGFTGSPAVADGRLVIAGDEGTVYCFGNKTP